MSYTLTVKCIENAYSEHEKVTKLMETKLPAPDKDGCSSLPNVEFELPDGRQLAINTEVDEESYGVGCYTNSDPRNTARLMAAQCKGAIHISFLLDSKTEISVDLA